MQLVFPLPWLCALFALYVSGIACATTDIPSPPVEKPAPHIALLLPLNSPGLSAPAAAIQQGFMAAAGVQDQQLPIRVYSDFDDAHSVVDAYEKAIANGAVAVVGPLTRNKIRQLADEKLLPVPTLVLNVVEGTAPPQMYFFGMAVEVEAQQIALLAWKKGLKQAIVISSEDTLARRLQFAFEEQWTAFGGKILREINFDGDTSIFADMALTPDSMVFFATNAEKSRLIHPYLPNDLPIYATSQIFTGNNETMLNFDLEGVRFVDMPWLLQTELPSIYPRANPPLATDYERLYALGIDAYRLIGVLLAKRIATALPLDGVTGHIRLNDHTMVRDALPALFVQGHAQSADAPIAPTAPMFPGQVRNASQVEAAAPMNASQVEATQPMSIGSAPKP